MEFGRTEKGLGSIDPHSPIDEYVDGLTRLLDTSLSPDDFERTASAVEILLAANFDKEDRDYIRRSAVVDYRRGEYAFSQDDYSQAAQAYQAAYASFGELARRKDPGGLAEFDLRHAFNSSLQAGNNYFLDRNPTDALTCYKQTLTQADHLLKGDIDFELRSSLHEMVTLSTTVMSQAAQELSDQTSINTVINFAMDHELNLPPNTSVIPARRRERLSAATQALLAGQKLIFRDGMLAKIRSNLEAYVAFIDGSREIEHPYKSLELGLALHKLGELMQVDGQQEAAAAYYEEAFKAYQETPYTSLAGYSKSRQALALKKLDRLEEAIRAFDTAFTYYFRYFAKGLAAPEVRKYLGQSTGAYLGCLPPSVRHAKLDELTTSFKQVTSPEPVADKVLNTKKLGRLMMPYDRHIYFTLSLN